MAELNALDTELKAREDDRVRLKQLNNMHREKTELIRLTEQQADRIKDVEKSKNEANSLFGLGKINEKQRDEVYEQCNAKLQVSEKARDLLSILRSQLADIVNEQTKINTRLRDRRKIYDLFCADYSSRLKADQDFQAKLLTAFASFRVAVNLNSCGSPPTQVEFMNLFLKSIMNFSTNDIRDMTTRLEASGWKVPQSGTK